MPGFLSVTQVRDEFLRRTGERRGRHGSSPVAGTEAEKRRKGEKEKSTAASQSNHPMIAQSLVYIPGACESCAMTEKPGTQCPTYLGRMSLSTSLGVLSSSDLQYRSSEQNDLGQYCTQ